MVVKKFYVTALISVLFFHFTYSAQLVGKPQQDGQETNQEAVKEDEFGRSTPKGAVSGLLKSLENEDYARASHYFDPGVFNKNQFDTLGIKHFKKVLDKYGSINPLSIISSAPNGNEDEGIDLNLEKIGSVKVDGTEHPILLEQIKIEDEQKIWVFSKDTYTVVKDVFVTSDESFMLDNYIPEALSSKWKGAKLGEWFIAVFIAIGAYVLSWLITLLLNILIKLLWKNYKETNQGKILSALLLPFRLILTVTLIGITSKALELSITVRQSFSSLNMILLWLALFFFLWQLSDVLFSSGEKKLREKNKTGSLSAIIFLRTIVKFVLIVFLILIIFDALGQDVTTGIAALGIGGIALALGAQKTVENLVGGISVVFDQPVNVGDFCKFGDTIGTVEEIGIRSTRIRTLNRTVVTIPNSEFSSRQIENYALRDEFLFNTRIGLRYETSHEQMLFVLKGFKEMLTNHKKVNPEPARVRFVEYASDHLAIDMFAYIYAVDWNDFLAIKEELNLQIAKVVEDSGSGFAFPSQTVYLAKDSGISDSILKKGNDPE